MEIITYERVSPHYYNTPEEGKILIAALKEIL